MNLAQAIRILEKEYEKAKKMDFINKPLAYAFYRTWRIIDAASPKNERETDD
jgi:hypothetical protein